jgi:hypothetical protein
MMLELLLTRTRERALRDAIYEHLRFLVFDELHTYRGRQGADVAMLMRRIRSCCSHDVLCIGTSATMVSVGSLSAQREQVAQVATTLFGRPFTPAQVIHETLTRSLSCANVMPTGAELATAMQRGINPEDDVDRLKTHPVAIWLENRVALEERDGYLVRRTPQRISDIVAALARESGVAEDICRQFLADLLQWTSAVNQRLQDAGQRYTILPFKLHQFISQTGSVYTTIDQDEQRFITLEPGVYKQDEAEKKPIFANVFSRASGHAFICVSLLGNRLEPREFRDSSEENEATDGYLIVGEDVWDPAEDLEYLPDSWVRITKKAGCLTPKREPFSRSNCSSTSLAIARKRNRSRGGAGSCRPPCSLIPQAVSSLTRRPTRAPSSPSWAARGIVPRRPSQRSQFSTSSMTPGITPKIRSY